MLYFDTSYLVRLYTADHGFAKVRALAATDHLACCIHGRTEIVAALHRKYREGSITQLDLDALLTQLDQDCAAGAYRWLALAPAVIGRLTSTYRLLPTTVALRAADASHLACAAENQFTEVFSNDTRLLSACGHFGLKGLDII